MGISVGDFVGSRVNDEGASVAGLLTLIILLGVNWDLERVVSYSI